MGHPPSRKKPRTGLQHSQRVRGKRAKVPLEIIDYLPINDNLLVIVNSLDLVICREASHSCGLAAPEDRRSEDFAFLE